MEIRHLSGEEEDDKACGLLISLCFTSSGSGIDCGGSDEGTLIGSSDFREVGKITSPVASAFPPLAHFTSKEASSHAAVISAYKKKTMGR